MCQDVNWARAGLGLPLLSDSLERKPLQIPTGPRPTPEGEDISGAESDTATSDPGLSLAKHMARDTAKHAVADTVVTFPESSHARPGRGGFEMSDLARSPLISGHGDPDSEGNKYKRRAPTDWLLR